MNMLLHVNEKSYIRNCNVAIFEEMMLPEIVAVPYTVEVQE